MRFSESRPFGRLSCFEPCRHLKRWKNGCAKLVRSEPVAWILIPPCGGEFESSRPSQAVWRLEKPPLIVGEMPANRGFCELTIGLQATYLAAFTEKTLKVSGRMPKYFRFQETPAWRLGSIYTARQTWQSKCF
jgi:hypothetical protein